MSYQITQRISDAQWILRELRFPRAQSNERSALAFLALLDLRPDMPWTAASTPLKGVTEMMTFMSDHYEKHYAPNTRETVRRQTIHQFCAAGLAVKNPDDPDRPTNSGKTVYQINSLAWTLARAYGTDAWPERLATYFERVGTLADRLERQRQLRRIPLLLPDGTSVDLSPGGQNPLIRQIVHEFCSRFTPGGAVWYIGDADAKFAVYDAESFTRAGIRVPHHGKMPDVIVEHGDETWLVVVEAVTSHGPIDPKRRAELDQLLRSPRLELVYVTAFEDRATFRQYVADIAWETEVWIAEEPDHLIHFDGSKFLGPYS
ncbi:MAG: BsuBI/PstI family type II restriction endonuclease [Acidimicrobiaceae bacterium]|nr:BsuBI/PstI family type II restriction endonuclease [Acidimicrobiaceae bacterium]MDE0134245.1 BsuBI/PstI family type II restriction endonuclease [Acidimicrobiaceae bacterium]MDE0322054.1 BsuBI/PstI family type II restriction endonuclease [Acidimicrobiaceae bacterium]